MFSLFKSEKQRVKERLDKFQFPEGFVDRLCKEQNWSKIAADAAIKEYLRFLYLAKFYGSVTPSKIVDQVWHLHLIYSDSYWNDMCKKVLKANVHHAPGTGNPIEESKYKRQYEDTQSAYLAEFGSLWNSSPDLSISHDSSNGHDFGGGQFGGSGAGSDWGGDSGTSDSSGGSSCSSHSSCSSSSCSSSCGSSCGGGD